MNPRTPGLEFRLLGPLEVTLDGRPVNVGGPQLRTVLARLLVGAGQTVSLAAIVDALWGDRPPSDANRTARTYVSRLRTALRHSVDGHGTGGLLLTRPPGYQLRIDPETVDAVRFERLAKAGRQALDAGQPRLAYERLTAALNLWRGGAFAEFDNPRTVAGEPARLDGLRLTVIENRVQAALDAGLEAHPVAELEALARTYPTRERLWKQLMTVLYRSGRQADALSAFHEARRLLVDEYGIEPSPALSEVYQRVLHHDAELAAAPATDAVTVMPPSRAAAVPVPAQLPIGVRDFVGRTRELAWLDALTTAVDQRAGSAPPAGPGTVVLAALSGTAGVGKTTLAVHWAHRVAALFPDGQLYVDLRGFDPGGSALDPTEAVRGFLDAFGVPAERIPAGAQAQAALYRSLLAGKRVLVLLDNARDVAQVRPLLPGSAGCVVLVASRNRLIPLVATEGARQLTLDTLTTMEARELALRRLGADRAAGEPAAVERIVAGCAGLPLAVAVATARAVEHPEFPLSMVAGELDQAMGCLDALRAGDPATDVRSVFSWSYRMLNAEATRMFRLLGLHPGPDISTTAAASLAGVTSTEARTVLAELHRAHLLTEHSPGRYSFHDLLRAYAAERARLDDHTDARDSALHRMFDHYLHTAYAGAVLLGMCLNSATPGGPSPGVSVEHLADGAGALDWFAAEHSVLMLVIEQAYAAGFDRHAWQVTRALTTVEHRRNRWHELSASQRATGTRCYRSLVELNHPDVVRLRRRSPTGGGPATRSTPDG